MNIRKNTPKCFFKFYLHISKKSSTFGTPFRVRQEGRKGQYRSAKLTGDFCLRGVLCVASNTRSAIRGTSSPAQIKICGDPKRNPPKVRSRPAGHMQIRRLFLKKGCALHF